MEQALAEVAARVPVFKPPTGQALADQLKRVANYKSPGIYVVKPEYEAQARKLKERAAAEVGGVSPDPRTPSRSTSPEEAPAAPASQQQKKAKQQPQQRQQGNGRGAGGSQQPTPEPQQGKPLHGGGLPRPAADRGTQITPEPFLQLVEDDLGLPSSQPSPLQRAAPPAKQKPRPPVGKAQPSGAAAVSALQQVHQRQGQGPSQQQGKTTAAKKAAKDRQPPLPGAQAGAHRAAKPQQQRVKPASGMHTEVLKQLPAPAPAKPAKRSRTVGPCTLTASAYLCASHECFTDKALLRC